MKRIAYGIDFGTTNSLASVWGDDLVQMGDARPRAFWNNPDHGLRHPHPSIVWYGPHDIPIVGDQARRNMASQEHSMGHAFVKSIKRKLGGEIEVVGGQRVQSWEVAAEIFRHLRDHASETGHGLHNVEIDEAVVTIPVNFNGKQRRDIRKAMQKAGISLNTFIHEPFAALLAHHYKPGNRLRDIAGKRFIVFDWGGGTLDMCIVEVSSDGSRIYELSHDGIEDRAGDDFDRNIMRRLKSRFADKHSLDPDIPLSGRIQDRFNMVAEEAKIRLSSKIKTSVSVPHFYHQNGNILDMMDNLERSEFEGLIKRELDAAEACVQRLLDKARLSPGLVDEVLLVGGTSNIPAVRNLVERTFGARVSVAFEPEASISRGAAIVAAEGWVPFNVKDVCVKLSDDSYFTILPAGTELTPKESRQFTFLCTDPRPGTADFLFYEKAVTGDSAVNAVDVILQVETEPEVRRFQEMDRIIAKFGITEDATLDCRALSSSVGKEKSVEIFDLAFGLKIS